MQNKNSKKYSERGKTDKPQEKEVNKLVLMIYRGYQGHDNIDDTFFQFHVESENFSKSGVKIFVDKDGHLDHVTRCRLLASVSRLFIRRNGVCPAWTLGTDLKDDLSKILSVVVGERSSVSFSFGAKNCFIGQRIKLERVLK